MTLSFRSAGVLLLLTACSERTVLEPATSPARSTPSGGVARSQSALGETIGGFPSDQERMLHVLLNKSRALGASTSDGGYAPTHLVPLVYSREANVGARFTGRHESEVGCYQNENCCVLGDAGTGTPTCVAPAECTGMACNQTCDAGPGQGATERYALFGFTTLSASGVAKQVASAGDMANVMLNNPGYRDLIYDDAGTELGTGNFVSSGGSCNDSYWSVAFGRGAVTVPRIPAASAIYNPPKPLNTSQVVFAANYFDGTGKAPQRAALVVGGHCFDMDLGNAGTADNGTYFTTFPDPDVLPEGCHPYYFLFQDGDGARHTYPSSDAGSLQLSLGSATCPLVFDPSNKLPADCETGAQQCPMGASRSCYTQDTATLGKGECRQGTQVCRNGFWSACRDMVGPFPEVCDGLDNDCDGEVDEGTDPNASCQVFGERGVCTAGALKCVSGRVTCLGQVQPSAEVCDLKDNDCDGVIDDGYSIATCGVGECFRVAYECRGGKPGTCVPGTPRAEIPDGIDNDCNGIPDDGLDCLFPDGGGAGVRRRNVAPPTPQLVDGGLYPINPPCGATVGQVCGTDGGWGMLLGAFTLPQKETCDGLVDDDCDGQNDTMSADQIGWERCGTGGCIQFGPSCRGGTPSTCMPKAALSQEVCNGIDDTCDGTIDEGCHCRVDDERPCYTGPSTTRDAGVCHGGKRTCAGPAYSRCTDEVKPSQELCNGLDDDCNGKVDDACLAVDGGTDAGMGDGGTGGGAGGGSGATGGGTGEGGGGTPMKSGCGCTSVEVFPAMLLGLALLRRRRAR